MRGQTILSYALAAFASSSFAVPVRVPTDDIVERTADVEMRGLDAATLASEVPSKVRERQAAASSAAADPLSGLISGLTGALGGDAGGTGDGGDLLSGIQLPVKAREAQTDPLSSLLAATFFRQDADDNMLILKGDLTGGAGGGDLISDLTGGTGTTSAAGSASSAAGAAADPLSALTGGTL